MASLIQNINIGWYGECAECADIELYDADGNLKKMFSNLVLILQVSNNGYKYSSWTMQRHNKQSAVWSSLSENVKKSLQFDTFVRNGQIITKLVCGTPYVIEIEESSTLELPGFTMSDSNSKNSRVIECFECPKFAPCICE
jgi:hypothetical protein